MTRIVSGSGVRRVLAAAALAIAALSTLSQPSRAFASFPSADQKEQAPAQAGQEQAPAPAAVAAPPAESTPAPAAPRQQVVAKQHALRAAMVRQQRADESRKAARRAFAGGVIIGILAARRR